MGIFDGCLLASDIDGTLLENGYINPRNVEKIEYFVSEGGKFCLCTGRSIGAVQCVLRQIDCISYTVAANGCMVYDHGKNEIMDQEYLPEADYCIAKELYKNFPFLGAEVHSGENVLTLNRTMESDIHQKYEELPTNCIDFESTCEYNWNKAIYMLQNDSQYRDLISFLEKFDVKSSFIKTSAVIDGIFRNYYEQLPPGVSKITGLKKLCETLGIKKGKLFAIGDYYNDFEMINNADIGAATADAPDEIKQSADYVTCKCIDGAVADFIDYLTSKKTERV